MRGGKREGAGRKPGRDNKSIRWPVRWTAGEQEKIKTLAAASGKTPTDFLRSVIIAHVAKEPN